MENIQASIGQRLKKARESRGISQDELGLLIDKGKSAISQYESGKTAMSITLLYMICEKLKCSISWVFTGEGPMGNVDNSNNFSMRNMKGNNNTAGINNTGSAPYVDERCLKELEKTKEKLETVEGKYIALLEKLSMQG